MIIRAYLEWSRTASAQDRAEAAGILAEVYLRAEISVEERRDAEAALLLALEDPSPLVRRSIAMVLGADERAPRPVIAALARDQADVASIVLANTPSLTDAELIDIAAFGAPQLQHAIGSRPHVSLEVSAAIAVHCDAPVATTLLDNEGAELSLDTLRLLVDRHGEDGAFREAMLARDDLPAEARLALAAAAAQQLSAFAAGCGWMPGHRAERMRREATETAAIMVAQQVDGDDMGRIATRLRKSGQMTPQLLMRAVLSGEVRLFVAALSDLAEVDPARAQGFVLGRSMMGFGALYRKAGLPKALEPAFAAAVAAWQELSQHMTVAEGRLSRVMIEMVISAIALLEGPEIDQLRAVLGVYQAEAARDEAKLRIADILAAPPVIAVDEFSAKLEDALSLELLQAA